MIIVEIELLQVTYGDCVFIYITEGDSTFTILMDGGPKSAYRRKERLRMVPGCLQKKLDAMKDAGKHIDLLIITHVDEDHIGGLKEWFELDFPSNDFVREIWINDDIEIADVRDKRNTSAKAASLLKLLEEKGMKHRNRIVAGMKEDFCWGIIKVLAPNVDDHNVIAHDIKKELKNAGTSTKYQKSIKDYLKGEYTRDTVTPENDASIAILLQTKDGENNLFLGDASITTIMDSIEKDDEIEKPLHCKWVKLSHHGSKNNFLPSLLDLVTAENFVFSTDGSYYGHPDKEVLSQLVEKTDANLCFNYLKRGKQMITKQDEQDYPQIQNRIKPI